jgi:hypothetical protein
MPGRRIAITVTVVAILCLTVLPSGSGPPLPFSYALTADPRWLADGILNLLLFVPLGLAVEWNARSIWIAVICGLLLSTTIEMAQTIIPGRDPALGDIIFNTLGTLAGAVLAHQGSSCLTPDPERCVFLTSISIVVAATVMSATVILLTPYGLPTITRSGNDLVLGYPTLAGALGLDEPEYWLREAFRPGENAAESEVRVRRERNHWRVRVGSRDRGVIGPTVGQGWTLLAYPNTIGRRWSSLLSGAWLGLLCLPVGFFARGRFRIVSALLMIGLLVVIPALAGAAPTRAEEWAGALLGLLLGACFGFLFVARRRLARSG